MRTKMKKKIRFSLHCQNTLLDEIEIQHVLPNKFVQAIGPFVFLEHIFSCGQFSNQPNKRIEAKYSNPHRGISTLTYIFSGEVEHFDSIGNHVTLNSGGIHWTNAGTGIVHEEVVRLDFQHSDLDVSVIRFWINLSSKRKCEQPHYFSLGPNEITEHDLPDGAGWMRIITGAYQNTISKIPCYSKEFLFHIHLQPGKQFAIPTIKSIEYGVFLPANKGIINGRSVHGGEFIAFNGMGEIIELINDGNKSIDAILFGGEPYSEPIVAEESFVMNTPHEITQAYNDYYDGKYGQIKAK
jgi:hypothetical protein